MQMMDVMDRKLKLPDGYLFLTSDSEDAITPVNDISQWGTSNIRWEKIKGGEVPEPPTSAVEWDQELFDHWIYLQAGGRLIFDFGNQYFSRFECSVLLPHFCNDTVSIEMKWLADNVEVYNLGVINTEKVIGIAFDIPPRTKSLTLQVTDAGDDNICDHYIIGNSRLTQIDPDLLPPIQDLMLSVAYLSLSSQAMDAMIPINYMAEWNGWAAGETGEKVKGEETPPRPELSADWNTELFEHWFYSFALSKFVFNLKGQDFTYFECDSILPNTCGTVASVEFIWFAIEIIWYAADVEVYKSDVITQSSGVQEIGFGIPVGTQTLTLQVTDGGNGINHDHFVIGNPRLLLEMPQVTPHVFITPVVIRNPAVGTQFSVKINISDGYDVQSYDIDLNYDPTALKYVSTTKGDNLPNAFILPTVVSEGNLKLIGAGYPSNGSGVLATIMFEVVSAEASEITLTSVYITNSAVTRSEVTTAGTNVVIQ